MKKKLRKKMINLRKSLNKEEIENLSDKIFFNLKKSNILNDKQNILIYKDFRNEVKTDKIIDFLLNNNKKVYIPKVNIKKNELDIYEFRDNNDLILSNYGILEPNSDILTPVDPNILDLILSPGVAFTKNCHRMGYGGGFYDKLLHSLKVKIPVIALAFEMQILDTIPIEKHDKQLDGIITEKNIYYR